MRVFVAGETGLSVPQLSENWSTQDTRSLDWLAQTLGHSPFRRQEPRCIAVSSKTLQVCAAEHWLPH